jgi:hypothetical protein
MVFGDRDWSTVISTRPVAKQIQSRTIGVEIGRIPVGLRAKRLQIGQIQVQVAVNSVETAAISIKRPPKRVVMGTI